MHTQRILSVVFACLLVLTGLSFSWQNESAQAAFDSSDFLKTDGKLIRNQSGSGEEVTLRGTNVGGWLTQEDWMSPLGEFATDRSAWNVSASVNGSTAASAIDGDNSTTWNTGTDQQSGQWFQIDMGSAHLFNRIYVDAGTSPQDYPEAYQVLVSNDGTNWKNVASGSGSETNTVIRFTPQTAQYIRIEQTGSRSNWWSIAELNVFSDPVLHNGSFTATASATASGSSPSNALDGDVDTVWTSGEAQMDGQTFTIDLGENTPVSKVLFDAGPTTTQDYPRQYEVWGSQDGQNWTKYASDYGSSRIIHATFWWTEWMRYIRIEQTGSSSNWWSIADIAVYSEADFDQTGWNVTASQTASGSSPANVIDGDLSTRWSTGASQTNGQWIEVDMGANMTFNQVVLDTEKNSSDENDYPRQYILEVSDDGSQWTQVASGQGGRKATPINFSAVDARYFRITQTGSSGNWWSIGELDVYLNNDHYSLTTTLEDRFGEATAENLKTVHQDTWLQESDLDNIQDMGMNVIRLPIGWDEFMDEDGTWKSDPWSNIDWLVSEANERDMYVILDLHTVPGGGCPWGSCGRVGPNPNRFWTSSQYQDWVVEIWETIAARYQNNPAVAGYDLINEPLIDYSEDSADVTQKSDYYDRLYDAIRAVDPDHMIFIAAFFGWGNMAQPGDYGWNNVVYEIHPYDMPGGQDWNAQHSMVETELADAAEKLEDPNWNVPILYGEYSLYHYDDVWAKFMSGLNALHVSWTNWTYKVRGDHYEGTGGYWGLYNSNSNPIPVINSDSASTISSKLQAFSTNNFQPNTSFIDVVSRFTEGQPWMATVPLDQSGWSASASSTASGESPGNALDWDTSTRWATGESQTDGQWFQVDMGSKHVIDQVSFETGSSNKWDFPREYAIQVSNDGTNWTTVKSGQGWGHKQSIVFDLQYAQYVRVEQTGNAPEWWSIAEFHVYSEPTLDRSDWGATASSTDSETSTGAALDGDTGTRWSTGTAQTNGQWYQVDMGEMETFNQVLIDAGSSTSDYPRGYEIQVSKDGSNWTTVASGNGSGPSVLETFPVQQARYLQIVQTGTASSWWSIEELNVYGEAQHVRSGWSASASDTEQGGSAANALDNDRTTRWSTGTPQSVGQSFQVDMGSNQWFNHIVMDSASDTGDYARAFIVEVSQNGTDWTTVANGEGSGPIVSANFPIVEARYIRVTLTEGAGNWWSIAEFKAYE